MTTHTPKLRFPEFSDNWKIKKFGEIFTFRTTNSFSRDNLNYEFGSVRNIHYGDIHTKFKTQFNLKNELVPFVNEEINIDKIPVDNYCKVGDLVIADASEDYADIGKSIEIRNLNNEKTIAGLHTFLARPDLLEMSLGFNGYIMQSRNVRLQIMTIAQGTKVLGISTGRLSNIELNIPQLPEQTKIANFLTAIDEKIQALKQKKTLLEQYKKGIMQGIFSSALGLNRFEDDRIDGENKKEILQFHNPKNHNSDILRFKNDDGSDFDDWEEKRLGEVSDVRDGTHDSPKYIEEGFPFITSKNLLENGKMDFNNITYISEEDYVKISKRSGVKIGDILFGMIGTIGNPVMVEKDGFAIKNVALIKEKGNLSNNFLIHFLNSGLIKKQFYEENKGGTQKFLSLNVIRELKIQLPSLRNCLSYLLKR